MIFLLALAILAADKTYGDVYKNVEIVAVYDGDTFTANIPQWPRIIGERVPVRIHGIDAPEMDAKDEPTRDRARAAKQRLVSLLRGTPEHRPRITLHDLRRDKYFRVLAVVKADGVDVGALLIQEGLAKVYDGGKK